MSGRDGGVSVVICAYTQRRWHDLMAAVESAAAQPHTSEVILVIDHEPQLLERARQRWPEHLVLANGSRRGLSGARNTGIEVATGDIVAFLDDDATAADDWLDRLLDPFDDPNVAVVGGRAAPVWPEPAAPRILPPELLWIVGCSYLGLPIERAEVRNVLGCSMAFRRHVLLAQGGFNLDAGRVGRVPLGCEETELCIRVRQADAAARVVYEPRALVHHRVSADRTTWSYLLSRSYHEGISKAALSRRLGRGDALAAETTYTRQVLPRGIRREIASGSPQRAAAILLATFAAGTGYLRGALWRHSGTVAEAGPAPQPVLAPGDARL